MFYAKREVEVNFTYFKKEILDGILFQRGQHCFIALYELLNGDTGHLDIF